MSKSLKIYFSDILESISEIETFTEHVSWDEFKNDAKTISAVERKISIIGEIVYDKIPKEFKERHRYISWRDIEKMRHLLIHHYSKISTEKVWDTTKNSLPKFKEQIQLLYGKEIEKDKNRDE